MHLGASRYYGDITMKKLLLLILLSVSLIQFGFSQDLNLREEILRINQIEDDVQKLNQLAAIAEIIERGESIEYISRWTITYYNDEINNREIYFITSNEMNDLGYVLNIQYIKSIRASQSSVAIFLNQKPGWNWNRRESGYSVDYKYDNTRDSFNETWFHTNEREALIAAFPGKLLREFTIYDEILFIVADMQIKFEIYGLQQTLDQYDIDIEDLFYLTS
jgi:hypothetical protein